MPGIEFDTIHLKSIQKKWHLSKVFFPMVIPSLDTFALNQSGVSLLNILLITRFLVLLFAMKYFMIYYLIYIFHQPLKHLQHKCFVFPCCVFSNEREADHLFSLFNIFKIKVASFKLVQYWMWFPLCVDKYKNKGKTIWIWSWFLISTPPWSEKNNDG